MNQIMFLNGYQPSMQTKRVKHFHKYTEHFCKTMRGN